MKLEVDMIEKINAGVLTPEILDALVCDYAEPFCNHITEVLPRKKLELTEKKIF